MVNNYWYKTQLYLLDSFTWGRFDLGPIWLGPIWPASVSGRHAHRNCDGTLKLVNRATMTCTSKEKEMYDQFQRERDGKIKATYKQKIESQTDNRRKSHQKENIYRRASPRRKSALSRLCKPLALWYGEANNRRTGYEPSRKDIDNAKDSQKDRDGGEMNVRTVFLIPLTYLTVRRN